MLKVLSGITTGILTVFFQALNANPPKSRDEIYHSSEWMKAMDPFCKQSPGEKPGTVSCVILVHDSASIEVEGGSFDYLERCFKSAIEAGAYGFLASKNVLAAESVLKKAEDKK